MQKRKRLLAFTPGPPGCTYSVQRSQMRVNYPQNPETHGHDDGNISLLSISYFLQRIRLSGQLVGSYGYFAVSMYAGVSLVGGLLIFWARFKMNKRIFAWQWSRSVVQLNALLPFFYAFGSVGQKTNDLRDVAGSSSMYSYSKEIDWSDLQ